VRVGVVAAAALLFLIRLGATGFWAPDEPRYGQVAEELRSMRHGVAGLVLLHLNGEPYTQKPPLYYWLAAALGTPGGRVTETDGRLPSALAGVALVALTLTFGTRLLGAATGLLGAALLLTSFEFAAHARRMQLDVLLALFETLALAAFWRLDRGVGRRRTNQVLLHGALGLAVLTKGPVGLLVPVLSILAYLAWERRLSAWRTVLPAWGWLLSAGPALVWIAAAVVLAPAGFFQRAVVDNLLGRFFAGTSHPRAIWYYAVHFPLVLLPWVLLAPFAVEAARRQVFTASGDPSARRAWRFLLAWVGMTLVFFSLSSGKRSLYVLTCQPAAMLLLADGLRWAVERQRRVPRLVDGLAVATALALLGGGLWLALRNPLHDAAVSWGTALAVAVVVAGATVATWRLRRRGAPPAAGLVVPVAAIYALELVAFAWTLPALDGEKSPRPVAEAAAALVPAGGAIGLLDDRALVGGLVYYGHRRVAYLDSAAHAARFLADGGAALVAAADAWPRIEQASPVPLEIRFRVREGSRALVVAAPRREPGPVTPR
jgi:4-amino-4-deoxy-L-arabinose transferase-like glycosyltransferase